MPYTLPGVLALIGWWWYISRKKQRFIGSQDGDPTASGLSASPLEGSNGLLEKGTKSQTDDTQSPSHTSPVVGHQISQEHRNIAKAAQDCEAALLLQQGSVEAFAIHNKDDKFFHESPAFPALGKGDNPQAIDHKNPEQRCSSALPSTVVRDADVVVEEEVVVLSHHSPPISSSTNLSDAERPEPEGEVATYCTALQTQDKMVMQRVARSEGDSLEMPLLAQELHQCALTSTPITAPTALAHDPTARLEDPQENQDLELLACGLISEVISAATQEVLGVMESSLPASSSTSLAGGGQGSPPEDRHPLVSPLQAGHKSREAVQNGEQGVANGCSPHSDGVHQTNGGVQSPTLLNAKLKGGGGALTEDSACSTCHSSDAASSEDLHSKVEAAQTTHFSERQVATAPLLTETTTAAETSLAGMEENSVEAMCEIKRLNGTVLLGNGVLGTCELETDQSGGSDVNSMDSVDSGCTMGAGDAQSNHTAPSGSDIVIWEIEVPKHLVGRLIGKQGRYVSSLKQNSGAKIYISTLPYTSDFQICHIEGSQQQVDAALALIGMKFKDLDLTNLYSPQPASLTLPSLPMTSWLLLPSGVMVEVIMVNIVSAGHIFVQQHTHPTYHALRSLDQQMFLCYSQPGTPALPSPVEVGVICAAPALDGAWWRAQVITFYKENNEVEIRYVDYGGYDRVKIDTLRQIRSDFVTLPFQGAEVLLDNLAPLPGEDQFSQEATTAMEEMTRGEPLLAQVSNYDTNTGLPLVHLWNIVGNEIISVNRSLADKGLAVWVDGF